MKTFQAIFLLFFLATSAWGQAGFKVRVNPTGMNFIREFIEEQATGFTLDTFVIENIVGYKIISHATAFVGLTISHFNIDEVFVDQTAPNEITIRVTNSTLKMNGAYNIDFLISRTPPDVRLGTIDFDFGQVTAEMRFSLNVDDNSMTSLKVQQCSIDLVDDYITIDKTEIDINDAPTHKFILNKVTKNDFYEVKKNITEQFCKQLVEPVVNQLNQLLSLSQGGSFLVVPGLLLNASLYETPFVNSSMMEIELDGTFYPASQPNIIFPYPRPALPPFQKSPSMAQGALSVRVLQTLLYSLVQTDLLNIQLPVQSLSLGGFNFGTVFGLLIPTFSNFINGRPLSMGLVLPEVPSVQLTPGVAAINGTFGLAIYAVNADGSTDHAVTFTMDLRMAGGFAVVDTRLKATVTEITFNIGVLDDPPAGQPSNLVLVNSLISRGNLNILPTINGLINNVAAIQIPSILGYSLENINVEIINDAILMSLDIYKVEYVDFDGDMAMPGSQSTGPY